MPVLWWAGWRWPSVLGARLSPHPSCRELPEFAPLLARDRSHRPRCLLWHGLLPGLGVAGERDPWAASLGQPASRWSSVWVLTWLMIQDCGLL